MVKESLEPVEFIYCVCGCGFTKPKYDSHKRQRKHLRGHANKIKKPAFNFKGGTTMNHGYRYIWKPYHHSADSKGYVLEHRLVYEEYHNCCLLSFAAVHHINENKSDNRVENLEGMMKSEHTRLHDKLKKRIEIN